MGLLHEAKGKLKEAHKDENGGGEPETAVRLAIGVVAGLAMPTGAHHLLTPGSETQGAIEFGAGTLVSGKLVVDHVIKQIKR